MVFGIFFIFCSGFAIVTSQSVTLFDDIHFSGESTNIRLSQSSCQNVPGNWNDRASSIKLDTDCVELFEHIDCGGRSIRLTQDSRHLDNFVELNFNDEVTSLKGCSGPSDDADLCVTEHNRVRQQAGLLPLKANKYIARASQIHIERVVRDRCEKVGNPHQCPGEPGFMERWVEQGYTGPRAGAENIAAGNDNCRDAVEGWMHSEGHRVNILRDGKEVGCGRKEKWWCCGYT